MKKITNWNESNRVSASVLASGISCAIVTPGAIFCLETATPGFINWLKNSFGHYIVDPHLEAFEWLSRGVNKSRQQYQEKKRETLIQMGKTVEDKPKVKTREERIATIADDIVASLIGLGIDFLASFGFQKLFNKTFNVNVPVMGAAAVETFGTLAIAGLLPIGAPTFSENLHHNIRRRLQKWGVERDRADDVGLATAYATMPSLLATLCTLVYAQVVHPHAPTQR